MVQKHLNDKLEKVNIEKNKQLKIGKGMNTCNLNTYIVFL